MTNEQVRNLQTRIADLADKVAVLEGQFRVTQNRLKQDMSRLIQMVENNKNS